jgi:putative intracellular protease/amidase
VCTASISLGTEISHRQVNLENVVPPVIRRISSIALSTTITVVAFAGIGAAGLYQPTAPSTKPPAAPAGGRGFDPAAADGKFIVAVVLGKSGSEAADVLAPYDVLASSPDFAVYTVADSKAPAPLDGGLWITPDYTFADATSGRAPKPDLVVVPAVDMPSKSVEQGARSFIAGQYAHGAHVLGICAGSRLLAASGILDGLSATSHWSRISALEESNPKVAWVRGERYVQDGRVTTTGGVTSSIPGTLKVLADIAGAPEASRVGKRISYPGWTPDFAPKMSEKSFGIGDVPVLINMAFPWGRPTLNIELADGVDEIDAAALFEMYSYSQVASTRAVSDTGTVRTSHGLTLRTEVQQTITGGQTIRAGSVRSRGGMSGFDAAFEQLGRSSSPSVVNSVAKMLEYPLDRVNRDQPLEWQQWRSPALLAVALLLALAAGSLPLVGRRVLRRR